MLLLSGFKLLYHFNRDTVHVTALLHFSTDSHSNTVDFVPRQ